jgi:ABC-type maltose transport system permease subunit
VISCYINCFYKIYAFFCKKSDLVLSLPYGSVIYFQQYNNSLVYALGTYVISLAEAGTMTTVCSNKTLERVRLWTTDIELNHIRIFQWFPFTFLSEEVSTIK